MDDGSVEIAARERRPPGMWQSWMVGRSRWPEVETKSYRKACVDEMSKKGAWM